MMTRNPSHRTTTLLALATALLLPPGCYDPEGMIERVRNDAIQSRLEEIDLGEFHFTLPRDPRNNEMTEVFLHLFGTSVRYRIKAIEQKLEEEEYLLKQSILVAVRETSNKELADPALAGLRERLIEAINAVLGDSPIERIGFYEVRLVRH